jgi:hypothetical protein
VAAVASDAPNLTTDPRTWRRPAPLLADVETALRDLGKLAAGPSPLAKALT